MAFQRIGSQFIDFVKTIKALRTPESGCPWDLEQDHRSLRPYLLEEAHEVLQAIDKENDAELCDELGDLLLQVVLHAQIAADRGAFTIEDVVAVVNDKMIRRHPHVFGDTNAETAEEVLKNWESIKIKEKQNTDSSPSSVSAKLNDIPRSLPALLRAQRIGEKAARFNFDWNNLAGVRQKLQEELEEFNQELEQIPELSSGRYDKNRAKQRIDAQQNARLQNELGDVLFSLCQLGRWLGIHCEDALRQCAERFLLRFEEMECALQQRLESCSEEELEQAWQEAKRRLAGQDGA